MAPRYMARACQPSSKFPLHLWLAKPPLFSGAPTPSHRGSRASGQHPERCGPRTIRQGIRRVSLRVDE
jgi:hypothetical protein